MSHRVLVLAQFAVPLGSPGGTRHIELFARLEDWRATILAADRGLGAGRRRVRTITGNTEFRTVVTSSYRGNNLGRVINWTTFALSAFVRGSLGKRPDVVYASSPPLPVGLAGWAISRVRRVPLVFEVRDLWPRTLVDMGAVTAGSRMHRLLVGLERFVYRRAEVVVVLAKGSVRHVEAAGVVSEQIVFIPNGAEPADFAVDRPFDVGIDGFIVAYTGAHGPANGLDFVLDAAGELASEVPEVQFLLVGDGLEKSRLQERAKHDGLSNVHFRDLIPKEEIPALLAAVDVGLHVLADIEVFRFAVSPNKLFDYMAAGVPVITNTPGEVADLVTEADSGLAVSPDGIAGAVRDMISAGESKRAEWGSNGRGFVEEHRSRRVLSRRLEGVLNRVVSG